jgi:hypothetical protein
MKTGIFLLAGLLTIIGAQVFPQVQTADDQAHQKWLAARYAEAIAIKPGMSRADLLRLFDEDGGLQSIPAGRYVLKTCSLIQIEVKFDTKYGVDYKPIPDKDLRITNVSKPYLAYMALD